MGFSRESEIDKTRQDKTKQTREISKEPKISRCVPFDRLKKEKRDLSFGHALFFANFKTKKKKKETK